MKGLELLLETLLQSLVLHHKVPVMKIKNRSMTRLPRNCLKFCALLIFLCKISLINSQAVLPGVQRKYST